MPVENNLIHRELSEQVIGAAMVVLNALGPGLNEKIYENALILELVSRGIEVETQQRFPVHYRGHLVGTLVPDLIVANKIIVDTKVVESFASAEFAQVFSYLAITGLELGLLLNFKYAKLQWKRVVRTRERHQSAPNE